MTPNIENVIRRTRRYWYEDGLAEVATGLFFLAAGAIFALGANISIEPGARGSALHFGLMGAAVIVSGGLTLAYFLRHNRVPAEDQP